MASTASTASTTRGNTLAIVSISLALLYPVTLIINDIVILVKYSSAPLPFPVAARTYTVLDYIAIPIIVAAIVLGHLALAGERAQRRVAKASLIIGYVSLAGLVMVAITLGVFSSIYAARL